jgi:hypothetical protein
MPRAEAPIADIEALLERGFVQLSNHKLQRPNRLLARLLSELPNDATAMSRLFGSEDAYQTNMRGALERRIAQIARLDLTLSRYMTRGLEDLPSHPSVLLSNMRGFVDRVFELIWQAEIPDKRIPSEWMDIWKRNEEFRSNDRTLSNWETTFPTGGQRLRLLNLMTGSGKTPRLSRFLSRGTCVLVCALYQFGDFGQHQDGARIDIGAAYAALHLCIELAASLNLDLQVEC